MNAPQASKKGRILLILVLGILLGVGLTVLMEYIESRSKVSQASLEVSQESMVNYTQSLEKLRTRFGLQEDESVIIVSVNEQKLLLVKNGEVARSYPISGSAYGIGSRAGSNKTPLGSHKIAQTFGTGAPIGTIFRSRVNTGKVATIYTDDTDVEDDLVTTRIMWLDGLEAGQNKGPGVDSRSRYIYIHGTQEEGLIGRPASHGCIRMKNQDVVELFDLVSVGTLVEIQE